MFHFQNITDKLLWEGRQLSFSKTLFFSTARMFVQISVDFDEVSIPPKLLSDNVVIIEQSSPTVPALWPSQGEGMVLCEQ